MHLILEIVATKRPDGRVDYRAKVWHDGHIIYVDLSLTAKDSQGDAVNLIEEEVQRVLARG